MAFGDAGFMVIKVVAPAGFLAAVLVPRLQNSGYSGWIFLCCLVAGWVLLWGTLYLLDKAFSAGRAFGWIAGSCLLVANSAAVVLAPEPISSTFVAALATLGGLGLLLLIGGTLGWLFEFSPGDVVFIRVGEHAGMKGVVDQKQSLDYSFAVVYVQLVKNGRTQIRNFDPSEVKKKLFASLVNRFLRRGRAEGESTGSGY